MASRAIALALLALMTMGVSWAKDTKTSAITPAAHARTYPAHDEQQKEGLTIAADPYDSPEKAAVFNVDYQNHGLLPIRLIVSNDSAAPVSLKDIKIELMTADRSKLTPASLDDVFARISRETTNADRPHASPLPLPFPLPKKKRNSKALEAHEEVEQAQFAALAVEPHSTQSGFLFFDVAGLRGNLDGANLYVSGVRNERGEELLYFEIPLKKLP